MSKLGDIAQLVERGLCKADVRSSSLLISTSKYLKSTGRIMAADLLALNKALNPYQKILEVKNAGPKSLLMIAKTKSRQDTKDEIETSLKRNGFSVKSETKAISSFPVSTFKLKDNTNVTIAYKPVRGGMSETTLNATITELFPCIAFEKNFTASSPEEFYKKVIENYDKNLKCLLNPRDAAAAKQFIDKAGESSKFKEKIENAMAILDFLHEENSNHPIDSVYWGYRAKPPGIMNNHPGDIFIKYKSSKNFLGVSLKAGGAKTMEPKLNTYVKPIFDYFGKSSEFTKLGKKLYDEQYTQIPGIGPYSMWGKKSMADQTFQFEQVSETLYNELYDKNLKTIREALVDLFNQDKEKTVSFLLEKVAQQQQDVPLVVIKAHGKNYNKVTDDDELAEYAASANKVVASIPSDSSSKQSFIITLSDGKTMVLDFTTRTNKVGAYHKMGQFANLAVKFNGIKK